MNKVLVCALVFVAFLVPCRVIATAAKKPSLPLLTHVKEVRSLTLAQAREPYPVRIEGVVTALSGWKNSFFLQDSTAGISVDRNDTSPEVHPGERVEVSGSSGPGLFAPVIIANHTRILGQGKLPRARRVSFTDLISGQEDSQRIEIGGVVHSAAVRESWGRPVLFLSIVTHEGHIMARVHDFSAVNPAEWVDATVTASGVCGTNFNSRRQLTGLRLFVPSLRDVHIDRPTPADPFAMPLRPLESILQFQPGEPPGHRVKVEGTVTYETPEGDLYIQDRGTALLVHPVSATPAPIGTRVEAVGFPSLGTYSPVLEGAMVRPVGMSRKGSPAVPIDVTANEIIRKGPDGFLIAPYDGLLVRLRGRLIERLRRPGDQLLVVIQQGSAVFYGDLNEPDGRDSLRGLQLGSTVQLTGVCSVRTDENREPKSFWILLRSAHDVTVLKRPSWWSARHTLRVLALAILAILGALVWITVLHRLVNRQTRRLRESEQSFRAVTETAYKPIISADASGRIVHWNPAAQRTFGYTASEVLGQPLTIIMPERYRAAHEQGVARYLANGEAHLIGKGPVELAGLRKDGTEFPLDLSLASWKNESGVFFTGIVRDLTERKRAEQAAALRAEEHEREQRERLALKDQFLSNVSHELRTPLAAIYWFTSNLADGLAGEITAEQREHLNLTLKNVAQLKKMISDILDVTRAGAGKLAVEPRETRLEELIADALDTCQVNASEQGIALRSEIQPALPLVFADPGRVRQILINLIDNGIKFTPPGGTVMVRARCSDPQPNFVRVDVTDTGRGIAPENLQKVFDRLYQDASDAQTSRKGLGLGLFISKELVTRHGGEIWVESAPGSGAAFSFTLPRLSPAQVGACEVQAVASNPGTVDPG